MSMKKAISWCGHRGREAIVHLDRWRQPGRRPRVCFLPWGTPAGDSTELRVVNIARALRAKGWRCVVVPKQLELGQRLRILHHEKPDLVFLQKSRHPLNHPRFYEGYPIIYDIDDADFLDDRLAEVVKDCCRESLAVIAGSEFVARWCRQYNSNVHIVWTGAPSSTSRPSRQLDRKPVVAWAPSMARHLEADQRIVAETLVALTSRTRDFSFRCYGVDDPRAMEPFLRHLTDVGISVTTFPLMPYRRFLRSLEDVAVGLAPVALEIPFNQGKSFGKVLAYLLSEVAVVVSPLLEYPRFFRHGENGMLPRTSTEWVDSVELLLTNPARRQAIVDAARDDYHRELTIDVAAGRVARILEDALTTVGGSASAKIDNRK